MTQEQWTAVDRSRIESLVPSDPALDVVLGNSRAGGRLQAASAQ